MLLDFFKKSRNRTSRKLRFERDIHAHLLPGVDDGPATMEESLQLIAGMAELGVRQLMATPHIYHQYYPNKKSELIDGFADLSEAIIDAGIDVDINLSAEYFLDEHFAKLLKKGELLPIANEYLLVELPFVAAPPELYNLLFDIQTRGYKPILAHPERYMYLTASDYEQLLLAGCQFQLNLLSISGYYGRDIEKRALTLLDRGQFHAIGSDVHNEHQLEHLKHILSGHYPSVLATQHWLNDFL
ncbi:MAG: CpsB/CapC family capsule biosynthesis tyrosine phosphatase [Bacteroidota bacterium]